MKKYIVIYFLLLILTPFFICNTPKIYSINENPSIISIAENEIPYKVYDEDGNLLFEKCNININDIIIQKDYKVYQIYLIDKEFQIGYAKLIKTLGKPSVEKNIINNIANVSGNNRIGLYMTHNDESYIIGDGTESIYGAGGIHDIAKLLKTNFEALGIKVDLKETLHIPHNSSAYSRSSVTAKELLNNNPDALFDIHRDGVARSAYITNYNGSEKSKVRIVVGQANPNKDSNLQFALYLMAVAEEMYPWLFADIYFASGHYNQALMNKMLLFEMGTYTIEKTLVENTVPALAKTISTTLYKTSIDENGKILINTQSNENTINDILDNNNSNDNKILIYVFVGIAISLIVYLSYILIKKRIKTK